MRTIEYKPTIGANIEIYKLNDFKAHFLIPPGFSSISLDLVLFRNGQRLGSDLQPTTLLEDNKLYIVIDADKLKRLPTDFQMILLIDDVHAAIMNTRLTETGQRGVHQPEGYYFMINVSQNTPIPVFFYTNGKDGREVMLDVKNEAIVWKYTGETDWRVLASIPAGKSAFDIAVEQGYPGTEAEWIAMLQDRVTLEEIVAMLEAANVPLWYGVGYEIDDPDPQLWQDGIDPWQIPNPIPRKMRGCLLLDNGMVNYYLDPEDWSKKEDGTPSNLDGADGMVMVEIPEHYRKVGAVLDGEYTYHQISVSEYPLAGFKKIEKFYYAAYESAYDNVEDKLASVVNNTARYRGGDNTDDFFLGRPATGLDLPTARQAVRNRGAGWELLGINELDAVRFLYLVEYQHRNSQLKLGTGAVYNLQDEEGNNLTGPPCVCGATNTLGNGSGKVVIGSIVDGMDEQQDIEAVRYRGIENIFGNVFELLDGVMSDYTADVRAGIFVATSPAHYADYTPSEEEKWKKVTPSYPVALSSYGTITRMAVEGGYLLPYLQQMGAGSDTFWGDYLFPDATEPLTLIHPLLHGGGAGGLSADAIGLFFCMANTPYYFSMLSTEIGSRIIYRPQ